MNPAYLSDWNAVCRIVRVLRNFEIVALDKIRVTAYDAIGDRPETIDHLKLASDVTRKRCYEIFLLDENEPAGRNVALLNAMLSTSSSAPARAREFLEQFGSNFDEVKHQNAAIYHATQRLDAAIAEALS